MAVIDVIVFVILVIVVVMVVVIVMSDQGPEILMRRGHARKGEARSFWACPVGTRVVTIARSFGE